MNNNMQIPNAINPIKPSIDSDALFVILSYLPYTHTFFFYPPNTIFICPSTYFITSSNKRYTTCIPYFGSHHPCPFLSIQCTDIFSEPHIGHFRIKGRIEPLNVILYSRLQSSHSHSAYFI